MCVNNDESELLELYTLFIQKDIPCEAFSDPKKALQAY